MSKEKRGYGTMIIVTFGALGAVVAALVGAEGHYIGRILHDITGYEFANWQVVYIIGGLLGISLLLLRIGTIESGMYKNMKKSDVKKGDISILFKNRKNFEKYIYCILVGVPIWYIIGLLVNLSQDVFSIELNITEPIINGKAVMYAYIGLSAGDLISGLLSQLLKSRKKVVILYLIFSFAVTVWFLYFSNGINAAQYYFLCFLLGTASGYWAIFVTIAAEQFGTNIRSTVANTVPNFVRGSVNLITGLFTLLVSFNMDNISSALIVGIICISLALFAIIRLKETFAKELDYYEEIA
jgi:MFS family permease